MRALFDWVLGHPAYLLTLWLLLMSLVLFVTMAVDKSHAQNRRRRVPESRLFLLAALGGAMGGWAAMFLFRHKTLHWKFRLGFPLLALLQLGLTYAVLFR